jgi:hypothetical protein
MKTAMILLLLAASLAGACADTNGSSRSRNSMVNWAATCATCGATVKDDYFLGSNFKAMGPGNY